MQLTHKNSYFARLNYVMQNPIRHGLVINAEDYRFCSAQWFRKNAPPGHFKTVISFKTDKINVIDDF